MSTSTSDWMARYEQQRAEQHARMPELKAQIIAQMKEAGVALAIAEFDGSGDSGQVELVEMYASRADLEANEADRFDGGKDYVQSYQAYVARKQARMVTNEALTEAVSEYVYELLEDEHPGWEINEGSLGTVTIDADEDTIHFKYGQRIEDVEWSEDEF